MILLFFLKLLLKNKKIKMTLSPRRSLHHNGRWESLPGGTSFIAALGRLLWKERFNSQLLQSENFTCVGIRNYICSTNTKERCVIGDKTETQRFLRWLPFSRHFNNTFEACNPTITNTYAGSLILYPGIDSICVDAVCVVGMIQSMHLVSVTDWQLIRTPKPDLCFI